MTARYPVVLNGPTFQELQIGDTLAGQAESGANSDITSLTGLTTALSVAQGGTGVTTSTGTGNVVLSTSPTLVTPILGTPTSGTLTNCTFPTLNQNTTGTAAGLSITLAIASGGTGLTTVGAAGNLLTSNGLIWVSSPAPISLPSQSSNSGKYLTTDGTSASWAAVSSAGVGSISILTRSAANISVVVSAGLLPILTSQAYGTICVLAVGGLPIYKNNLTTTQVGVN